MATTSILAYGPAWCTFSPKMTLSWLAVCHTVIISTNAQVITWNGAPVTSPLIIYHDEVSSSPHASQGALICRSDAVARVSWIYTTGYDNDNVDKYLGAFRQDRTGPGVVPSVSRLVNQLQNTINWNQKYNGIWACRLNNNRSGAAYVGLYSRLLGGYVTPAALYLKSVSFLTEPPTFTLFANSTGGPPRTSTWSLNGTAINSSSDPYTISTGLSPKKEATRHAVYESTLTVTGRLPGEYQYAVSNRATYTPTTKSIIIAATPAPVDLRVLQTGIELVTVSWTPPSPPPSRGYRITTDLTSDYIWVDSSELSHNLSLTLGPHTVQVVGISHQLPSYIEARNIIVLDIPAPANVVFSSLTATSVTISWTQPEDSLPVDEYTVNVAVIEKSPCTYFQDKRIYTTVSTSVDISDLQEFFTYSITITVVYNALFEASNRKITGITLPERSPTQAPLDVTATSTSVSISVNWSNITCIERNGEITGYAIEFGPSGEAIVIMQDTTLSFTRDGLPPLTNYTFRVAGVNSAGTGVYSDLMTIRTAPGNVSNLVVEPTFFSIVLTWSPPQQADLSMISYEVTYKVNGSNPVTVNTTALSTTFTIPSLTPGTSVSATVTPYTSAGKGATMNIIDITTINIPAMMNVTLTVMSDTSVLVSWDRLSIPEITGYIVYYKTGLSSEPYLFSSENSSAVISNLTTTMNVHQFDVAAVIEINNNLLQGPVSKVIAIFSSDERGVCISAISVAVSVIFLLVTVPSTVFILILVWYIHVYHNRTA